MLQEVVTEKVHAEATDPGSGLDRAKIREQLQRILNSPLFRTSKRYPSVLKYLVDRAIEASHETLKERTIGVDVLGRDPDYDTNEDPTVRVVVGEIRKRLLTYYREPAHALEIRIELPVGSYTPRFSTAEALVHPRLGRTRYLYWISGVAICAALLLSIFFLEVSKPSTLDRFWEPIVRGSPSVLISVGQQTAWGSVPQLNDPLAQSPNSPPTPSSEDAGAANSVHRFFSTQPVFTLMLMVAETNIASYLHPKTSKESIRASGATSLADLRQGPAVLIGSFSNYWVMHINEGLRFRFRRSNEEGLNWIEDKENTSQKNWLVNVHAPYTDVTSDYAVITRVYDPTIGQTIVSVGGVTAIGTVAGSEFLTHPAGWDAILRQAPKDWERKNLQVVIGVNVVNGNAGAPRVLATYFW